MLDGRVAMYRYDLGTWLWAGPIVFQKLINTVSLEYCSHTLGLHEREMSIDRSRGIIVRQCSEQQSSEHASEGAILRIRLTVAVAPSSQVAGYRFQALAE